jgi:tetratricopeptide (TPR) repeat protein
VSEETTAAGSTPEGLAAGLDSVAVTLALGGADREEANAFLRDQRKLISAQLHHLNEQLKQIHLDIWEKVLGVLLRIATAIVGLAVAAGLGFLIWNAAQSNELIVDSFSVPPDLAQKGMSGPVLAAEVVNRLITMQAQTTSFRAPQSYASGFNDSVKLEIPETGISLAELDRFLREKLGDNTHISGALFRTAQGLRLTARAGAEVSDSFEGREDELDDLIQRSAEAIYYRTQPFRYATYVWGRGRIQEAHLLFQQLTRTGSPSDRAWAWVSVGSTTLDSAGSTASDDAVSAYTRIAKQATEIDPTSALPWSALGNNEELLGRFENALFDYRQAMAAVAGKEHGQIRANGVAAFRGNVQSHINAMLGDYAAAGVGEVGYAQSGNISMNVGISAFAAIYQAAGHDTHSSRATLDSAVPDQAARAELGARYRRWARIYIAHQDQDWARVLREAAGASQPRPAAAVKHFVSDEPYLAIAEGKLGRFDASEARIRRTPSDCYPCLIARAKIAEMQGQQPRADWWFAQAVQSAPSIPFAYSYRGEALLGRGQPDAAIAQFKLANQKGPHFADALEGWGEALMAKNKSHLAVAKFAEAEKYAPNWGRLHLKWGEAQFYAGKADEAKLQFVLAAALDLTPSEKQELARHP